MLCVRSMRAQHRGVQRRGPCPCKGAEKKRSDRAQVQHGKWLTLAENDKERHELPGQCARKWRDDDRRRRVGASPREERVPGAVGMIDRDDSDDDKARRFVIRWFVIR